MLALTGTMIRVIETKTHSASDPNLGQSDLSNRFVEVWYVPTYICVNVGMYVYLGNFNCSHTEAEILLFMNETLLLINDLILY